MNSGKYFKQLVEWVQLNKCVLQLLVVHPSGSILRVPIRGSQQDFERTLFLSPSGAFLYLSFFEYVCLRIF